VLLLGAKLFQGLKYFLRKIREARGEISRGREGVQVPKEGRKSNYRSRCAACSVETTEGVSAGARIRIGCALGGRKMQPASAWRRCTAERGSFLLRVREGSPVSGLRGLVEMYDRDNELGRSAKAGSIVQHARDPWLSSNLLPISWPIKAKLLEGIALRSPIGSRSICRNNGTFANDRNERNVRHWERRNFYGTTTATNLRRNCVTAIFPFIETIARLCLWSSDNHFIDLDSVKYNEIFSNESLSVRTG